MVRVNWIWGQSQLTSRLTSVFCQALLAFSSAGPRHTSGCALRKFLAYPSERCYKLVHNIM